VTHVPATDSINHGADETPSAGLLESRLSHGLPRAGLQVHLRQVSSGLQ